MKKPDLQDDSVAAVFARDDRWMRPKRNGACRFHVQPSCAARASHDRHVLRVEIEALRAQVQALQTQYLYKRGPTETLDGGRRG